MALLATIDDLTRYLSGDQSQALDAADAMVRKYCGWHIAGPQTDTVTLPDWWSSNKLLLPTLNLTSVTSITVDGTDIDLSTVYVDPAGWIVWLDTCPIWTQVSQGNAVVVMTHGYTTPPADVVQVVAALAARGINSAGDGGMVATSRQVGQVSVGYSAGSTGIEGAFLPSELAILRQYRIPALP
jgi:hypothetical protein